MNLIGSGSLIRGCVARGATLRLTSFHRAVPARSAGEAFSNPRGVLDQRLPFSAIELLYPPYKGKLKEFLIDFTVRWL